MEFKRTLELSRGEDGAIRAAVFTGGEASDGHILHIPGGETAETLPLFVNHQADPRTQLGSLHLDHRTDGEIVYRLDIHTDGDGAEAEIRRDLLSKIQAGHVSRMSGRWDSQPGTAKRRTDLKKGHYAHVGGNEQGARRNGLFFESWQAVEGSVVGLGADPQATLRWAEEAESEPVAAFYRSLAEASEVPDTTGLEAAFGAQIRELADQGLEPAVMRELIDSEFPVEAGDEPETPTESEEVEREVAVTTPAEVEPLPTANLEQLLQEFTDGLEAVENRIGRMVADEVAKRRGARR